MKPLSEWTLGETKEWCATHKCSGCALDDFDGCALMNVAPECWRFPRTKVDAVDTLPVQLDEGAYMPERAHKLDAGLDLRSPIGASLLPLHGIGIRTGVHIQLPPGTVGMLKSKSGLNTKFGITSEGVIDEGYSGELVVKLYNHSSNTFHIKRGDKISQLVILPVLRPTPVQVDKIEGGERGDSGFGSTGR